MSDEPRQEPERITFSALVLSLASTAAIHFGDLAEPGSSQPKAPDLEAARHMIDILSVLDEKTRGNLTAEERQLLEQVLYELRMRFVDAAARETRIIQP
jgi:hypothetical protein